MNEAIAFPLLDKILPIALGKSKYQENQGSYE